LIFVSFARDASLRKRRIERIGVNYGQLWLIACVLLFSLIATIRAMIGGHWILKPAEIIIGASLVSAVVNAWCIFAEFCAQTVSNTLFPVEEQNSMPQTKTCNKCGAKNSLDVTVCWNCHNTGHPIDHSADMNSNNYYNQVNYGPLVPRRS
jgi:ribosomal protein L40E